MENKICPLYKAALMALIWQESYSVGIYCGMEIIGHGSIASKLAVAAV